MLLACNYRSEKRQFSLLSSNLRGRQVSYPLSIILCEDLCIILFIYNKLSYIFINSVFYYHCEQLRAYRPDKWYPQTVINYQALPTWYNQKTASLTSKIQTTLAFCSGRNIYAKVIEFTELFYLDWYCYLKGELGHDLKKYLILSFGEFIEKKTEFWGWALFHQP